MKLFNSIIILLFACINLHSDQIADSLTNELNISKSDTAKISLLIELSSHIYFSDKYSSLNLTEDAIENAENINYQSGLIRSLIARGILYRRMKESDSAMIFIDKAYNIAKNNKNLIEEYSYALIEKGRTFSSQKKHDSSFVLFKINLDYCLKNQYEYGIANSQIQLGKYYQMNNLDSSLVYLQSAIYSFDALGKEQQVVKACNAYATTYAFKGDLDNALINFQDALKINLRLNQLNDIGDSYSNIALVYYYQAKPDSAIVNHLKSLKYYERANNLQGVADKQSDIAILYKEQEQPGLALKYLNLAVEANKKLGYKQGLARSYNNIANIYLEQEKYAQAKSNFEWSLEINKEIKDSNEIAVLLGNLGLINFKQNNFDLALNYYEQAEKLNLQQIERRSNLAENYINIGELYQAKGDDVSAMTYLLKAKKISEELNRADIKKHSLESLSKIYENMGEYRRAYAVYKEYTAIKDSIFNDKNLKLIESFKSNLDEQEEKLYKETKKNLELVKDNNMIIIYTSIIVFIVLFFIIIYIFIQFKNKKRVSEVLSAQKKQILIQKKLVDEKNEEIYSSIRYAQKIQNTIIPTKTLLDEFLDNYFVYYKPKDIVSGDFYWFEEYKGDIFIAAADCTGHGIPGSMLSLIGNRVLNDAIKQENILKPDEILEHINIQFLYELNQKSGDLESRDGMDICLIKINKDKQSIEFSGAKRPLIYTLNGEINVIKGDKYSIGGNQNKTDINFITHYIKIEKGMNIYLTTDGFVDQIGGNGKKFGSKRLRTLFLENSDKSMNEQSFILDDEFYSHIGNEEQRDDITMIGIEL